MYILTKSKIASGLQCRKKLWFDVNQPIKQDVHIFYIGNRFGDFAREHYGSGVNLTGNLDAESALRETEIALNNPKVNQLIENKTIMAGTNNTEKLPTLILNGFTSVRYFFIK